MAEATNPVDVITEDDLALLDSLAGVSADDSCDYSGMFDDGADCPGMPT